MASCMDINRGGAATDKDIIVPGTTNLELIADSVALELLPVKNTFVHLYKGELVVAAGIEVYPEEDKDSIYVKVVHSEELQGWLPQRLLVTEFVPDNGLSRFIFALYRIPSSFLFLLMMIFTGLSPRLYSRRNQDGLLFLGIAGSPYPAFVLLLVATASTVYESMQMYASSVWLRFLYDPVFSPFGQPWLLFAFIALCWFILIAAIASVEDLFGRLSFADALVQVVALFCCAVFCHLLFTFFTRYYVGYLLLPMLVVWLVARVVRTWQTAYYCGNCGYGLRAKGVCPSCGAINK